MKKIIVVVLIFSLLAVTAFSVPVSDNVPELQKQVKNARWLAKVFGILAAIMFAGLIWQESGNSHVAD